MPKNKLKIIDTHVHITWNNNINKANNMLKIIKKNNIEIFAISTSPLDFKSTIDFSLNNNLHFAIGLAPNFISYINFLKTKAIIKKYKNSIFAIGEIGIDYENSKIKKSQQIKYFKKQLKIASKFKKPVLVHNKKDSNIDIFRIFKLLKFNNKFVLHNYNGDIAITKKWLEEENVLFSIGNQAFYNDYKYVINSIRLIPLDRLVIETDSPGFPIKPNLNKVKFDNGDPSNIFYVIEQLSKIKGKTQNEIIEATTRNAQLIV